jgi:molybdopterin/thiamine biosynthesis adenylyltransferase
VLRPRIKTTHTPIRLTATLISIGGAQHDVGAEMPDEDGSLWRLLQLMDGERTAAEVTRTLLNERPDLDATSIDRAINDLIDAGHVEDVGGPPPPNLSAAELERYERPANYFGWIDLVPRASRFELQGRLKSQRVVLCGLGGSGSAVAAGLVAAGVGALHCVDFDTIEPGNLTRQLLYTEDDLGAPKVDTAVARLRRQNPFVEVTGETLQIKGIADVARLMRGCHLFVLCADMPRGLIQHWVNQAAFDSGTPWQVALYAGPMLVTGIFAPGVTKGCFACLPTPDTVYAEKHGAPPLERIGDWPSHAVLAPTANLTGHAAALDAIYFLVGLRPTTLGTMFHLSFTDLSHSYRIIPTGCAVCEVDPSP